MCSLSPHIWRGRSRLWLYIDLYIYTSIYLYIYRLAALSACHASNSRAARAQELCENRRCSSFCYKIKKMSLQEVCENRLRIITGGGAVFGFLHLRVGNFKNESRLGLFLSHKHVSFCRNFPSCANVHSPLLGLDEGLRNPNGTAFRV